MSEVDDGKTPTTRKCLSALGFQKVGWLMGLEPTTTGITILTFLYFTVLIQAVQPIQINGLRKYNWTKNQLQR